MSEKQIRRVAGIYVLSQATILCYGMGLTQHQEGSRLLQQIANLLLLRGNFGKPGAGIFPICGHSNVQGDHPVAIDEKPAKAYLARLRNAFGFEPPRAHGHHTVEAVEAMVIGQAKVFIGIGGNCIRAVPDTDRAYEAMQPGLDGLMVTCPPNLDRLAGGFTAASAQAGLEAPEQIMSAIGAFWPSALWGRSSL